MSPAERRRLVGLAAMVSACSIWGLGPIWIRAMLDYLPPVNICLLRVLIGAAVLAPWLGLVPRERLRLVCARPTTWLGGLGLTANMLCYAAALRCLSPAEVNLLFQINVVANALFGRWFYHEPILRRRIPSLVIVLVGVSLVILGRPWTPDAGLADWRTRLLGALLALGAGVSASGNQVAIRDVSRRALGVAALVPMQLLAALLFGLASRFDLTWQRAPDARFVLVAALLGVLGTGLAVLLVNYALPRISMAQAGITGTMQPVVTLVAVSLMGEPPTVVTVCGAALVIGGVIDSARLEGRLARAEAVPAAGG